MDTYTLAKTRWRPNSKSNSGKGRRCSGYCSVCHQRAYSRHATKTLNNKDLEAEYIESSGGRKSRSATAFVDWFYSPKDEFEENAEAENYKDGDELSLAQILGEDVYAAMLREHIEAEKQLKEVSAGIPQIKSKGDSVREINVIDDGWDLISTAATEFTVDDWEEVVREEL